MRWKLAAALLSLALLALLLERRAGNHAPDVPAVVVQVKRLKELVTVRMRVQQVVSMTEQKQPLGAEWILLLVQGEALGGIDLANLAERDVTALPGSARRFQIRLPDPQITAVFLDEKQTKVWDRHVTWWTPWVPFSPDLETRARQKAVADVREAALQMGILQQAERNARSAVRELLGALQLQVQFTGERT